jgi:tRNA uridine 5-carboxymethylaminomethyl modification enzyme
LRRPELSYDTVLRLLARASTLTLDAAAELETEVKYAGYVLRQGEAIARFKRLEESLIPEAIDFASVPGLSTEVRERLIKVRPRSLGQAARMPGVTPAAVSILAVHLHASRS